MHSPIIAEAAEQKWYGERASSLLDNAVKNPHRDVLQQVNESVHLPFRVVLHIYVTWLTF